MQSWKVTVGPALVVQGCVNTTWVITDTCNKSYRRNGAKTQFRRDFHPEISPHVLRLSMRGTPPQVLHTNPVMAQISQRAMSCMSVPGPFCPRQETIQPQSGSVVPVMVQPCQSVEGPEGAIHVLHVWLQYNQHVCVTSQPLLMITWLI